uniref:Uncharacterized protein n=1 Tax=Streptomyces sp. NBC_00093 TaxID=2975649 RepID=A0AAU2AFW5_9ACTN
MQHRSAAENGQVLVDRHRVFNERELEADRTVPLFSAGFGYVAGEGQALTSRYRFTYDAVNRVVAT